MCGNEKKSSASATTSESAAAEALVLVVSRWSGRPVLRMPMEWLCEGAVRGRSIDSLVAAPAASPFVAMALLEHTCPPVGMTRL